MGKNNKSAKNEIISSIKSEPKTKNIIVRLSENQHEQFKSECEKHGVSIQKVMEQLIIRFLKGDL